MASSTLPSLRKSSRWTSKHAFWLLLALAALFVLIYSELPLLHTGTMFDSYRTKLIQDRLLLFPHALCGTIALLSGPLQFSTRLRRRNLQFHRVLGRVYVISVFLAAPLAVIISTGSSLIVATWVQASAWFVCTLAAFLTARNRHLVQHRQWMIRSYAVTFTFITVRILNPWPRYFNLSDASFVTIIIVVTFLSVALPDIAFNWRELTTRRA